MNQKLQFMKRNISYLLSTILVLENIEFIKKIVNYSLSLK